MSKEIKLKDSVIGGGSRVTVQSMLNVPAADVAGSVMQAVALERAGCEIIRLAVIDEADAKALSPIWKRCG